MCQSTQVSSSSNNTRSEDSSLGHDDNEKTDPSYMPCVSSSSSSDDSSVDIDSDSITDKSYIVYGSALETLFGNIYCNVCGLKAISTDVFIRGTLLGVNFRCEGGHDLTWKSQPEARKIPIGNLVVSASVLFSGGSFTSVSNMFSFMNLQCISRSTYHRIQNNILFGVIDKAWEEHQQDLFVNVGNRRVNLAGDGRCDSSGFCAKYGTPLWIYQLNKFLTFISLNLQKQVTRARWRNMDLKYVWTI